MTLRRSIAVGLVLVFAMTTTASAQETSVEVEITATAEATTTRPRPPRPLPIGPKQIQNIRQNTQDRILNLREDIKENRIETRIEIRNSASSSAPRRDAMKDMRENRTETRDRIKEIRGNVKERVQALVKSHVGAVMRRSENALSRFDELATRIDSRIDKLKERGADTASVEASLATSVSLIATAEADLAALKSLVESVSESSDTESVKFQIRTAIEKLTASVKAAHESLLETARALTQISASVSVETETN